MINTVLLYLEKNDEYLFLYRNKKQNDFNKGKYVGIGGKIEDGESVEEALLRETKEEIGVEIKSYKYRGIINFSNIEIMHLFTSSDFVGEIKECNEGTLRWIKKNKISELPMWEGDMIFFNLLKENAPFFRLYLKYDGDKLVDWRVKNEQVGVK